MHELGLAMQSYVNLLWIRTGLEYMGLLIIMYVIYNFFKTGKNDSK